MKCIAFVKCSCFLCSSLVFAASLHHVACYPQTQKVWALMVGQLGMSLFYYLLAIKYALVQPDFHRFRLFSVRKLFRAASWHKSDNQLYYTDFATLLLILVRADHLEPAPKIPVFWWISGPFWPDPTLLLKKMDGRLVNSKLPGPKNVLFFAQNSGLCRYGHKKSTQSFVPARHNGKNFLGPNPTQHGPDFDHV